MNDSGSYSLQTLFAFNGQNGSYPLGALIEDASGDLFGTATGGGPPGSNTGSSTVFEPREGKRQL